MWHQRRFSSKCIFGSCVLLIFGALIYTSYIPYSNFYDQLANENILIEKALQRIPTCTSDDRSRQRALLYTLQTWKHFAQQNHIQYWIAYGTLVGYVQRRGLLPHDSNIDLFIMAQDTAELLQLSQLNFSSDYKLKVHPQWYLVEQIKRSYFYSEEIDFLAPNARFINVDEDLYLNIWPIYDYNPNEARIEKNSKAMLTAYDTNYKWKSSPREWTFPLRECEFSGIKVWCPAKAEKLVADIYEEISLNMSSRTCVNGSWVESDKYRSAKKKLKMKDENSTIKQSTISFTSSTKLSDYDLIEKALDHIPTCTPNDRRRQRILLIALQAWAHLAEKHNLQYWIAYGTLVGYVQRRGLFPHDADIDVVMMTDDVPQLINISQTNFSLDYEIKVQPQWNIVGETKRSYFRDQGIHFIAPNARFINRKTRNHVDIFPAYNFNPLYSNNTTGKQPSENITEYDPGYRWLSYPRNWTYPLQTCYFSEIKVLCPAQPEKLVATMFGVKSLTKSDTKCVNGSWVSADIDKNN